MWLRRQWLNSGHLLNCVLPVGRVTMSESWTSTVAFFCFLQETKASSLFSSVSPENTPVEVCKHRVPVSSLPCGGDHVGGDGMRRAEDSGESALSSEAGQASLSYLIFLQIPAWRLLLLANTNMKLSFHAALETFERRGDLEWRICTFWIPGHSTVPIPEMNQGLNWGNVKQRFLSLHICHFWTFLRTSLSFVRKARKHFTQWSEVWSPLHINVGIKWTNNPWKALSSLPGLQ